MGYAWDGCGCVSRVRVGERDELSQSLAMPCPGRLGSHATYRLVCVLRPVPRHHMHLLLLLVVVVVVVVLLVLLQARKVTGWVGRACGGPHRRPGGGQGWEGG